MPAERKFQLAGGKECHLIRIRRELIPNSYLLAFPRTQGEPSPAEVAEMLVPGTRAAQDLAHDHVQDREAFTFSKPSVSGGTTRPAA